MAFYLMLTVLMCMQMTAQGDETHVLYTSSVLRTRFNAMERPAPTPVSTAKFRACTHGPPC